MCFWSELKKSAEKFIERGHRENCDIQKLKTQWKSFRMARRRLSELSWYCYLEF